MTLASKSYLTMYDQMPCITQIHGAWDVLELSSNATFKKMTIVNDLSDFDVYATNPFLIHPNTFDENVTSILQNPNCDGMSLVEQDDGTHALVLVELKSKCSKYNLVDAYQQLVFSMLKAIQLLCLCNDFNLNKYKPIIIIGCHGFINEENLSNLKDFANKQYQSKKSTGSNTFFGSCLPSLLTHGECMLPLGKLPFLDNLPLHGDLTKCNVRIVLATGPDGVSPTGTYKLTI